MKRNKQWYKGLLEAERLTKEGYSVDTVIDGIANTKPLTAFNQGKVDYLILQERNKDMGIFVGEKHD